MSPGSVRRRVRDGFAARGRRRDGAALATPKSRIFTRPSRRDEHVVGLRDRGARCPGRARRRDRAQSGRHSPQPDRPRSGPRPRRVRSVSPDRSSHTKYGTPSAVPMSCTDRMFGWLSAAAARASCSNRRRRSGSVQNSRGSSFTATSRRSRVSRARNTSPIPPRPRGARMRYGPSDCDGGRVTGQRLSCRG